MNIFIEPPETITRKKIRFNCKSASEFMLVLLLKLRKKRIYKSKTDDINNSMIINGVHSSNLSKKMANAL